MRDRLIIKAEARRLVQQGHVSPILATAVVLAVCFVLGLLITIAEPDLQVLAEQVPAIPNRVLTFAVAAGVGAFLVIAQLRIFFHIPLAKMFPS